MSAADEQRRSSTALLEAGGRRARRTWPHSISTPWRATTSPTPCCDCRSCAAPWRWPKPGCWPGGTRSGSGARPARRPRPRGWRGSSGSRSAWRASGCATPGRCATSRRRDGMGGRRDRPVARHHACLGKRTARTEEAFERDHKVLLDAARSVGFVDFKAHCDRWELLVDPDGAEQSADDDRAAREVHLSRVVRGHVVRQADPRPDLRRDRPHHPAADRARALRGRLGRRQGAPGPRADDPRPRPHPRPAPRRRAGRDGHPRPHRPRRRPPARPAVLRAGRLRDLRRPDARAVQPHRAHPRHRRSRGSPRPTSNASCSTARPGSSTSAPSAASSAVRSSTGHRDPRPHLLPPQLRRSRRPPRDRPHPRGRQGRPHHPGQRPPRLRTSTTAGATTTPTRSGTTAPPTSATPPPAPTHPQGVTGGPARRGPREAGEPRCEAAVRQPSASCLRTSRERMLMPARAFGEERWLAAWASRGWVCSWRWSGWRFRPKGQRRLRRHRAGSAWSAVGRLGSSSTSQVDASSDPSGGHPSGRLCVQRPEVVRAVSRRLGLADVRGSRDLCSQSRAPAAVIRALMRSSDP